MIVTLKEVEVKCDLCDSPTSYTFEPHESLHACKQCLYKAVELHRESENEPLDNCVTRRIM